MNQRPASRFVSRLILALTASALAASAQPAGVRIEDLAPRSRGAGATLFARLPAEETGLVHRNVYDDPAMWAGRFREFSLGAVGTGVAIADFDRDGRPDIFAVNKTGQSRLYRNLGDMRFEDVTERAGLRRVDGSWETGATWADVNNDGWPDLYLCRFDAPNQLWINQGDGTFVDQAEAWGVAVRDASVHGVFADYDRDGDLDLFLLTNILDFDVSPTGRSDRLFRNEGGRFVDVTRSAGIWGVGQGHAALWFDADDDGRPDLYVANDFEGPDRFYRNNGDGTFTDVVDIRLPHTTYFSMGLDFGDLNNDGHTDFLVSDMRGRGTFKYLTGIEELARGIWEIERTAALTPQYMRNALYLGNGTPRHFEAAWLAGLAATDWTWAVRIADLNSDGREDVFITTGMVRNFIDADAVDRQNVAPTLEARGAAWRGTAPLREANLAFRNDGDLRFAESGAAWGLDEVGVSFGAALADLDGDGDLDLVYSNYDDAPSVLRNDADGGRLVVALRGTRSNVEGVGARVEIVSATSGRQVRQLFPARGIVSSDEPVVHFGLGRDRLVTRMEITWPSGTTQVLHEIPADRRILVTEPLSGETYEAAAQEAREPGLWMESSRALGLVHEHREQAWDEFASQPLLPRRLGQAGPGLAVADVNGDGRPDVFVGGGAGQPGTLWLATSDSQFRPADGPWARPAGLGSEIAPLWLEANGDGHPDLLLAMGGVRAPPGAVDFRPRLFLNDGTGGFRETEGRLPALSWPSVGAVAAADFDRDGWLDVFLGARMAPGRWPETGSSVLLQGGADGWRESPSAWARGLAEAGLVTAALWSDADGDGWLDLLVALEWGPVRLWLNRPGPDGGRILEEATQQAGFGAVTGWWTSLTAMDVDGDGAMDYVAGNAGLNTKYRASAEEPVVMLHGDLDGSGRTSIFEAEWEHGVLRPVRGRSKVAYALPRVARRFATFADFARADVPTILGPVAMAAATRFEANELRSGVWRNDGAGRFRFEPLPHLAQLAPVQGVVAQDFDGDGRMDLALSQNSFAPEPSTGRFHGGTGLLLRGDGRGGFTPVWPRESGLMIPRDGKALVAGDLDGDGWPDLVGTQNRDEVRIFRHAGSSQLRGTALLLRGPRGNPLAAGVRVAVWRRDGTRQTHEVSSGGGYFSQSEPVMFVAYEPEAPPQSVEVRWPDGMVVTHPWREETGARWQISRE